MLMENIKTFIEKAIKGEWKLKKFNDRKIISPVLISVHKEYSLWKDIDKSGQLSHFYVPHEVIFMSKDAWQAVGKVEGWIQDKEIKTPRLGSNVKVAGEWKVKFHRFIYALYKDKTIEEAVQEI